MNNKFAFLKKIPVVGIFLFLIVYLIVKIYSFIANLYYKKGREDQSRQDEEKMKRMHEDHEKDREEWKRIKKEYDDLF